MVARRTIKYFQFQFLLFIYIKYSHCVSNKRFYLRRNNIDIHDIVLKCTSSAKMRPDHQPQINVLNNLIRENATSFKFILIDNSDIEEIHLWKDKLHLKISSNFENILDRLNMNDEYNNITKEQLEEILSYACKSKYVSTANYNNKLSYRVNDKDIEGACNICGEKLLPYKTEDFPANKIVEYITRDTFESLAYEIYDLKSKVHDVEHIRKKEPGR